MIYTHEALQQRIKTLLMSLCKDENLVLDSQLDLFAAGLLDSFGVISFISSLEQTFNLKMAAEEFTMENFKNIHNVALLIERLS